MFCVENSNTRTDVPTVPTGTTLFCDKDEPVILLKLGTEVQDGICFLREVRIQIRSWATG